MRNKPRRKGSVAVETALALMALVVVGYIGADMYQIGMVRTRLEGAASSVALNLSAQKELTRPGLDVLTDIAMQGHTEYQQMIIMNVRQSGRINWHLERGGAADLCEAKVEGDRYTGELPVDPPETGANKDEDLSEFSLVIVQACRSTGDVSSYGDITAPSVLQVESCYRANNKEITLDTELSKENLIEEN